MSKVNRFWLVEHFDGDNLIKQYVFSTGIMTDKGMEKFLQYLDAKYNFDDEDLIACFFRKKTKNHRNLIEVRRGKGPGHYWTLNNPHFTARSIPENELDRYLKCDNLHDYR
ncbi:MAG: hypothetical protein KAR06_09840 [Deltaproteobacteria bacterium]|nr:hypothetical protein [Deltaproteobacteria bacterium]